MKALLMFAALLGAAAGDFQGVLDHIRSEQAVPGAAAVVVQAQEARFLGASGLADLETGRPADVDTPFYIGSVSKVLTAVLVLRLVEEERVLLDNPVTSFAGGRAGEPVRIRDLLSHGSGLPREGNFGYWFSGRFPDRDALRAYLADAALRFAPGTDVHYSNVGYAALGLEVEAVLGEPFVLALRNRVLLPLGMRDTGAPGPVAGIATGYTPPGRLLPNDERPFAGVTHAVGDRRARNYHDAGAMTPAFGIYSTAEDMGRLVRFLLGDGDSDVLSPAMRQHMRERQSSGRGLGLRLDRIDGHPVARHDGWFAAHRAHLLIDVEAGIGVVVLTNSDSATPGRIAEALYREAGPDR